MASEIITIPKLLEQCFELWSLGELGSVREIGMYKCFKHVQLVLFVLLGWFCNGFKTFDENNLCILVCILCCSTTGFLNLVSQQDLKS